MIGVGLLRQSLAAFGIDLGERFQILVQRRPHFAVGVIVAPFAPRSRVDLDAAANQFLAEIDELLDALLEGGKLLGIVILDQSFPVLDDVEDAPVELEQAVAVFLHHRRFSRHVDAARFHHDGIDQRIDALDVERSAAGGRHRFGESSAFWLVLYWDKAVMAATSSANSAKTEYNFAASENRDAMSHQKMSKGIHN